MSSADGGRVRKRCGTASQARTERWRPDLPSGRRLSTDPFGVALLAPGPSRAVAAQVGRRARLNASTTPHVTSAARLRPAAARSRAAAAGGQLALCTAMPTTGQPATRTKRSTGKAIRNACTLRVTSAASSSSSACASARPAASSDSRCSARATTSEPAASGTSARSYSWCCRARANASSSCCCTALAYGCLAASGLPGGSCSLWAPVATGTSSSSSSSTAIG
mmetsp:Transcript_76492/g.206680  ORF Transcript_76492/g.206680 Transcript_76492/m.206680 type:complete len:223 (-) Transcript_76492:128-796(-)